MVRDYEIIYGKIVYNTDNLKKYKEIKKLYRLFRKTKYKVHLKRFLGGYSLTFDDFDFDVVENVFSYGNKQDKLEIMGLYTCEEMGGDSVMGHLTAKEIFEKFISIYGGL